MLKINTYKYKEYKKLNHDILLTSRRRKMAATTEFTELQNQENPGMKEA